MEVLWVVLSWVNALVSKVTCEFIHLFHANCKKASPLDRLEEDVLLRSSSPTNTGLKV